MSNARECTIFVHLGGHKNPTIEPLWSEAENDRVRREWAATRTKPAGLSGWRGLKMMATARMNVSVHDSISQARRQVSHPPVVGSGLLSDGRSIHERNYDRLRKMQSKHEGDNIVNKRVAFAPATGNGVNGR